MPSSSLLGSGTTRSSGLGRSAARAACSSRTGTTPGEKQASRLSSFHAPTSWSCRLFRVLAQATWKDSGYSLDASRPKRSGSPFFNSRMYSRTSTVGLMPSQAAVWSSSSGRSSTASASSPASDSDSRPERRPAKVIDSSRSKRFTWTSSASADHSCWLVVTRTWPGPSGSSACTLAGSPAPSSTISQLSAVARSRSTAAAMDRSRLAPVGTPRASASAPNCSRAVPRPVASTHQTMSYSPLNRWTYSSAIWVLPMPPGPHRARTPPSVRLAARWSCTRSRISPRPVKRRLRRGTFCTRGGLSGKRGGRSRLTACGATAVMPAASRTRRRAASARSPRSATGPRAIRASGSGRVVTLTAAMRSGWRPCT